MMTRTAGTANDSNIGGKDGGLRSTLLGDDGLVTEFTGNGTIWLQTRDQIMFRRGTHEDDDSSGGIGVDDSI